MEADSGVSGTTSGRVTNMNVVSGQVSDVLNCDQCLVSGQIHGGWMCCMLKMSYPGTCLLEVYIRCDV